MEKSNYDSFNVHVIPELSTKEQNPKENLEPSVVEHFLSSPWYFDIIFVLQHLQTPPGIEKTRARFLKQKEMRFCILNKKLNWKDLGGVLLNYVDEQEAKKLIKKFHARECGMNQY